MVGVLKITTAVDPHLSMDDALGAVLAPRTMTPSEEKQETGECLAALDWAYAAVLFA